MRSELLEIGKRIKKVRNERGLTQEKVAEMIDMSIVEFGKIERGEVMCLLLNLAKISKVLDVPISYLINGESPVDDNNCLHSLIKKLGIVKSYYAEQIVMNYFEVHNIKWL